MSDRHSFFSPNFRNHRSYDTATVFRRTFAQGHGPSFWATHDSAMHAIYLLLGLNTSLFAVWQYARYTNDRNLLQQLHANATLSWTNFQAGRYWTVLTSAFSHIYEWHFAFNMMAMFSFGRMLSYIPGVGAFHVIALSVGSGLVGSFAWLYQKGHDQRTIVDGRTWGPNAISGRRAMESAVGASGMVMGMGAAATCLMPFAPVYVMFIPFAVPLWVATGGFAAVDTYFLHSEKSPIGHAAHLGGAVWGALYYFAYLRGYGGIWKWLVRRR